MRRTILLIPLLLLPIFKNNNCMHRRMFKKSYQRQKHMSRKRRPKKVRPRIRKREIARKIKRVTRQQEESFYREPRPKVSLAEFRRLKNGNSLSHVHVRGGCRALSIRPDQNPFVFFLITFLLLFNGVNAIKVIPTEKWPSTVHSGYPASWSWDDSSKILGIREKLPSGSMFGCDIGVNYTVTCCASDPDRHILFDVGGIIGDQPGQIDTAKILAEAEEICGTRSHHYISEEAKALLKPKYLQNFNDTRCTIETFKPDFSKFFGTIGYNYLLTRESPKLSCNTIIWDVKKLNILPTFAKMIKNLASKFVLPSMPKVFIFDNQHCDHLIRGHKAISTTFTNDYGWRIEGVGASYDLLQRYSDEILESIFGHELTHRSQERHSETGNSEEVEADIGSILANPNPCLAMYFAEDDGLSAIFPTRENVNEALKLREEYDNRYPSHLARKYMIAIMHKFYRKARALLLLTGKEWPY